MNYYPNPNGMMMGGVGMPTPSYSVPYGYGGYNGNYFAGGMGMYNTFNPYALQQQQEEYRKKLEAEQKKQQDLQAKLYRIACSGSGVEPHQGILNHIYGRDNAQQSQNVEGLNSMEQFEYSQLVQTEQLKYNEQTMIDQMCRMSGYDPYLAEYNKQMQMWNDYNRKRSQQIPEDVGMFEYFKYYAGQDYLDAQETQKKRKEQQVQQLYDNNRFNNFLTQFSMNGSIDDMTIRMPSVANEQERMARRKAFIDKIMSN